MTTELMTPNSLSKGLTQSLKQAGEKIALEMIVDHGRLLEKSRASFEANSLYFGMLCIAKKLSLKHGQWSKDRGKLADSANLSERSVRVYMQLAKRFLSALEQGDLEEEFKRLKMRPLKVENFDTGLFIVQARRAPTLSSLEKFIGGRSLDRMLKDFRAAEQNAEAEEAADNKKPALGGASSEPDPKTGQFDFFGQLNADLEPAISSLERALGEVYWINESVPASDKLNAIQQVRSKLKDIEQRLKDKEASIREGSQS